MCHHKKYFFNLIAASGLILGTLQTAHADTTTFKVPVKISNAQAKEIKVSCYVYAKNGTINSVGLTPISLANGSFQGIVSVPVTFTLTSIDISKGWGCEFAMINELGVADPAQPNVAKVSGKF